MSQCCDYGPVISPPMDEYGYVQSFALDDVDGAEEFFLRYGFAVLREAASAELVDMVEGELMEAAGLGEKELEDLELVKWGNVYGSSYNMGKGFVGFRPAMGAGAVQVRQNPQLLAVYERILGTGKLYAKIDRFGLMRPTAGMPQWRTETGFVHWDQNPTVEPNFSRVQGILTLTDHTATSGGFHCIPGSHLWFEQYGEDIKHEINDGDLIPVKGDCLLKNHVFRIPAKRGSFILWDSRTAHGNWPNQGTDEWRKVVYMTFFPQPEQADLRVYASRKFGGAVSEEVAPVLTDVGRKLFALEPYPEPAVDESLKVDLSAGFSLMQNGFH